MSEQTEDKRLVPWTDTKVTIHTQKGHIEVTGLVHELVPGLAVTSNTFGQFDVTHTLSGKLITRGFERMWNAAAALASYGLCADWTQDADGLSAELQRTKDEPCGHPEFKTTTLGMTRQMTKGELVQSLRSHVPFMDEFPWESGDAIPRHQCSDTLAVLLDRLPPSTAP